MQNTIFTTIPGYQAARLSIPVPPRPTAHNCGDAPAPPRRECYEAYHCRECDELSHDTGYALYECENCATCFTRAGSANDNNQCPSCKNFAHKVTDHACSECEEAVADIVWVYECPVCQDLVLAPEQEETDRA